MKPALITMEPILTKKQRIIKLEDKVSYLTLKIIRQQKDIEFLTESIKELKRKLL